MKEASGSRPDTFLQRASRLPRPPGLDRLFWQTEGTGSVPTDSHVHTRSGYNAQKDLHHRAGVERRTSALQPRTLVSWKKNEGARPAPPARHLENERRGVRGTTTLRQTCRRGCFGAICVQRFDDSRNSAIHTTYRSSLRSSSLREPRYPLLRVVFGCAGGAAFLIEEHAQRPEKLQTVWCGCVLCVRRRHLPPTPRQEFTNGG
mmetsp:Transcript_1464/g.5726  ORF Transcript_1464/g.5726 Transcript_1464/m.5726 type:complete len:204 (+) Transcript_1464:3442-4053(+)